MGKKKGKQIKWKDRRQGFVGFIEPKQKLYYLNQDRTGPAADVSIERKSE